MRKQIGLLVLAATLLAAESLSTAGCSSVSNETAAPPSGWRKVEAGTTGTFSIYAPPGWDFHQRRGIDSFVGGFAGDGVVLYFDFGRYSSPSTTPMSQPTWWLTNPSVVIGQRLLVQRFRAAAGLTFISRESLTGISSACMAKISPPRSRNWR